MWKMPSAPQKNHMSENYQRLKNIAAEGQKKRYEPLKAHFIPGVTKNDRYAHIESKVSTLRGRPSLLPPQKSFSDELANRRTQQGSRFLVNGGPQPQSRSTPYPHIQQEQRNGNGFGPGYGNGPSRLSRSSIDLRSQSSQSGFINQQQRPLRRQGSISASGDGNHLSSNQSLNRQEFPSVQILQTNPPDESIYKWKFNEDEQVMANGNFPNSTQQPSQCHRVEYLPCDGICAEETIDNTNNPESARSTSSRTSRGCNTEETRIFPETKLQQQQQPYQFRGMTLGKNEPREDVRNNQRPPNFHQPLSSSHLQLPQAKGMLSTTNGLNNGYTSQTTNGSDMHQNRQQEIHRRRMNERNFYPFNGEGGNVADQMRNMNIRGQENENRGRTRGVKPNSREVGSGDAPHTLGTVPKYLKQRQEEWRNEEAAKKAAEQSSHIPTGYVLMSEDERVENLRQFRKSYEMLIAELNRIPITVDTMRVKNHRAELDRQLTRLEEAMKTFSRPKVWVKVDD